MTKRQCSRWAACVAAVSLLLAACSSGGGGDNQSQSTQGTGADQFKGVDVTVLTFTGPQIAEPLQRRAPDFSQRTGANIKVVTVPFADLYDKILTDLATGTNSYDAFVFDPQWMGDFVPPGYLEDITDRVKADQALKWDDIAPFFRDFSASYKGRTYTIPLDGDFQMVYYRSDLLQRDGLKPPATWDEYLAIARPTTGPASPRSAPPSPTGCRGRSRAPTSRRRGPARARSSTSTR
jgi:multiple sugar transport system substrate-binding protein